MLSTTKVIGVFNAVKGMVLICSTRNPLIHIEAEKKSAREELDGRGMQCTEGHMYDGTDGDRIEQRRRRDFWQGVEFMSPYCWLISIV